MASRMSRGGKAIAGRRRKPLSDRTNALHESPPPPPSSSSSLAEPRPELAPSGSPRRHRAGRGGGARNPGSGSAAPALALSRPRSGSSSAVGSFSALFRGSRGSIRFSLSDSGCSIFLFRRLSFAIGWFGRFRFLPGIDRRVALSDCEMLLRYRCDDAVLLLRCCNAANTGL